MSSNLSAATNRPRYQTGIFIIIALLGLFTTNVIGETITQKIADDPIALIDQDFTNGTIDLDSKAMLIIQAIKAPETLPAMYQTASVQAGEIVGRSATMAILEIKNSYDQLTLETRSAFDAALARPGGGQLYASPGGFFLLHYYTNGADAVPLADNDSSGVPDYIEKCASYCDTSLAKHLELNYLEPPSDGTAGGDARLDVYFESMGYYGYAVPEVPGPEPWNDYSSYLVLHRNFFGFPNNTDPEGNQAGAAKATVAHEFHHCVQFAYDAGDELWFMEMDATYMEDIVFEHVNDNYNYLPSYLANPQATLTPNSGGYSHFIWGMYLAQAYDTSLMVSAWEGARYTTASQAISDTLEAKYGVTQDEAFTEFTEWNFFTGSRDQGAHHDEAAFYPTLSVATSYSIYPVVETVCPTPVAGYGSTYIVFNSASEEGNLSLSFTGSISREWAAYVIKLPTIGGYEIEHISLDENYDGSIEIENIELYSSVILVGVNIQQYSGTSSFYYSAAVHMPFLFSTEIISDNAVYPDELKYFNYKIINQSPTAEVIDILYSDDEGWLPASSLEFYLPAGDSVIAQIPVDLPVFIVLGDESLINFRAQLRTQPLAGSDDSITGLAIPKRGDVNYDAKVNLADITILIAHVYLEGDPPTPDVTGDFDCDDKKNLADITKIIAYVYLQGDKSPCDSYEQ